MPNTCIVIHHAVVLLHLLFSVDLVLCDVYDGQTRGINNISNAAEFQVASVIFYIKLKVF